MDTTPSPTPAAQPSRRVRYAKAGALVATGALAATALTGIAFAAGTPGPTTSGAAPAAPNGAAPFDRPGTGGPGMGLGFGHRGPGMGFGGNVLHGEAVVKDRKGATVTVRLQTGTVTSASASEVVVTSEDGVTWTWPVTSTTKVTRDRATVTADQLRTGDVVRALGSVAGTTVTTRHIHALSPAKAAELKAKRDAMKKQFGANPQGAGPMGGGPLDGGPLGGGPQDGAPPAPSGTA